MNDISYFIRKNYKLIIPFILIIFIILIFLIAKSFTALMPETEDVELDLANTRIFETIRELLEYYECEFISINRSEDRDYNHEIHAKLKLPPYSGIVSNEEFYMSLLNDMAFFYDYSDFIIIDDSQELKIKLICENGNISKIIVNGIEDYFNQRKAELALRKYKPIKETELSFDSDYLTTLSNNDWNYSNIFGTKESIFNGYEIYYDEGIEVKKIQGKIYNIIFKNKYKHPIVNGLTVDDSLAAVEVRLGEPTFNDTKNNIIGYKGKDIYVFFGNGEISVYRRDKSDSQELLNLLDTFKKGDKDLLEFMNELTYLWPDYNEYIYNASSVFISYPLKGFEIKINYNNERGIIFYNNFRASESVIERYLDSEDFKAYLQEDYVFKTEVNRLEKNKEILENTEEISDKYYESELYDIYVEKNEEGYILKTSFISKDAVTPNRELNDSYNTWAWISDTHFVFGKIGKGLYLYDATTGTVQNLLTGKENYNITESDHGFIIYDGKEQRFAF